MNDRRVAASDAVGTAAAEGAFAAGLRSARSGGAGTRDVAAAVAARGRG